jgi:hypothetical protein
MDESPTPGPASDRPVWGPPQDPLISDRPPRRVPAPPSQRRRHPAGRARRIAGWAAVASSAALVGYMVTANAQGNPDNSTATPTVLPTAPSIVTTPSTVPTAEEGNDDDTPATTTPAVQLPIPSSNHQNRQLPPFSGGQPNSSTHGS